MNPTTTTTTEAQSINAAGQYRDTIDAALTNVAEMRNSTLNRYEDVDDDAALTLRDRNSTVYAPETVAEAEALVVACQYALRGEYLTNARSVAAIRRVQYEAAAFDRGVRKSTHDRVSDRERLVTDGGDIIDAGDDGEVIDPHEGEPDDGSDAGDRGEAVHGDGSPRPDGITVVVEDDVRPPAEVVAAVEDSATDHALKTGRDEAGVTMTIYTHAYGNADTPDGWRLTYATTGRTAPEGVPEYADMAVVLRPE